MGTRGTVRYLVPVLRNMKFELQKKIKARGRGQEVEWRVTSAD